jgi:hypothetical protein
MRSGGAFLVAVLWPMAAFAQPAPQSGPQATPPLVGLDGRGDLGLSKPPPIPDAKGNAGPAEVEKKKLIDPPRPPPQPAVLPH